MNSDSEEPTDDLRQKPVLTGKAATQEKIIASAASLFLSQGYRDTTVKQIADAAGVSRATVFWHFSEKAVLFRASLERLLEPLRASLETELGGRPLAPQVELTESFVAARQHEIIAVVTWALDSDELRDYTIAELLKLYRRFLVAMGDSAAAEGPGQENKRLMGQGIALAVCANILVSIIEPSDRGRAERMAAIRALVSAVGPEP